jgi:ATP-dependent exoDNAse (exonuclease V) beta subunit
VRVTAAAGTGKTTTMEEVAGCLLGWPEAGGGGLGYDAVTYVTFNRTAVEDASQRLAKGVDCRTLHSLAFKLLGLKRYAGGTEDDAGAREVLVGFGFACLTSCGHTA